MRILHIIDTLEFGGAEKVLVALANAAAQCHEVRVCCLRRTGALTAQLDPRIAVSCMHKGTGDDPLLPLRLARRIRADGGCDVVHTHNWSVFLEGGLAAAWARVPVAVHTVHGPYGAAGSGAVARLKRAARHALERRVARRFRGIVAVSDAIRAYIPATTGIPARQLLTIHNGIAEHAPAAAPSGDAGPLFVSVGRLDAIKNQALMLRAFARIAGDFPQARLQILGDGPQRPALEQLCEELRIRGRVELPGFRDDVDAALAGADVFLLTSHYEGVSIALLEAMRAGLPAVATRVGGVPETVIDGQTGLLVADGDEAACAAAMARLAADAPLRVRMGQAARALQQREFSLQAMLQRYEALYTPAATAQPAGAGRDATGDAACR